MIEAPLNLTDFSAIYKPYEAQFGHFKRVFTFDPPSASEEVQLIPALELFEPAYFREMLAIWAQKLPTTNLKVAASLWSKHYIGLIVYRTLGLLTLGGIGLDSSLANLSVALTVQEGTGRQDGKGSPLWATWRSLNDTRVYPERYPLASTTRASLRLVHTLDELYQFTLVKLFQENFAPAWEQIHVATGISKKILWGNLGVTTHAVYNFLTNNIKPTLPTIAEDSYFINESLENSYVVPGANPLYRQITHQTIDEPGFSEPIRLRQTCCLWYRLSETQKCLTCPLTEPTERLARWKTHFAKHSHEK
jgi:ferric iron reductase protein FhuF